MAGVFMDLDGHFCLAGEIENIRHASEDAPIVQNSLNLHSKECSKIERLSAILIGPGCPDTEGQHAYLGTTP
jgi:hypothetical protein